MKNLNAVNVLSSSILLKIIPPPLKKKKKWASKYLAPRNYSFSSNRPETGRLKVFIFCYHLFLHSFWTLDTILQPSSDVFNNSIFKNFTIFTRTHHYCSHFLIKLQAFRVADLFKKIQCKWIPVNIVKLLMAATSRPLFLRIVNDFHQISCVTSLQKIVSLHSIATISFFKDFHFRFSHLRTTVFFRVGGSRVRIFSYIYFKC